MTTDIPALDSILQSVIPTHLNTTVSNSTIPTNIKSNPPPKSPLTASSRPTIPDSGDRTEFPTGAVRDRQVGKGRCDLLPLDVLASITGWEEKLYIARFQDTGNVEFLKSALWCFARRIGKYDSDDANIADLILKIAKRFEDGAVKYEANNWRRGIPCRQYIDSGDRHFNKFMRGDTDEEHDAAFGWNILCCIWTAENMPELNEYAKGVQK